MDARTPVIPANVPKVHHPRRHAAVRTDDYVFSQLIPYIGNKRKLLHLIGQALDFTGVPSEGTFVDLFTGSTVVARWAKRRGLRVIANDWEPYSHQIATGTVTLNAPPAFAGVAAILAAGGGHTAVGPCNERVSAVFGHLNALPPVRGYVSTHLCPADDDDFDVTRERMFFTQANGRRIDAIAEEIDAWMRGGAIDASERAYLMSALIYAVSYASNTSGVFKGFHNGWGGKTGTALYRIRGRLTLAPPVLHDNRRQNIALREDAQKIAVEMPAICGGVPDVVYIDPPYNQHPYGSNYHVLNTIALWDKPELSPSIVVDGKAMDKSAIRKDWRTERRSPYTFARQATTAFENLVAAIDARWLLVSYSTDGNIPARQMLETLSRRGRVTLFTERYKRYRVSTPRMSAKSHNTEFVAAVEVGAKSNADEVNAMAERLSLT
ncbi:DNA adenine methylase [Humisphaera borealis]|uniref:site-specific DNA-methyltransferase (adenine-specific) n=1 Tax=Humisphaera borealis TaxID=2807512 RepID=A0A7M2WYH4_9BACT|nr:DNA adenine methylase [Humisphaera borealis]QOV90557.1 DNA adenine methylase [Humisphaera borealis]